MHDTKIVLVANYEAKPLVWHFVQEQYRLDLAVSYCGINNGESWRVYQNGDYCGKICNPCTEAVLVARGVYA